MIYRLFFFLAAMSISTAQAQKTPKKKKQKKETNHELRLDKLYPVSVTGGRAGKSQSPCPVDSLILSLKDSLQKEGYKIMDSVQLHDQNQLIIKDITKYTYQGLPKEAVLAKVNSRILRQTLRVQNFSCLSDKQEYAILIYTSPKGGISNGVNQTFTLPKDSPARIIDIVLGLIRRE